MILIKLKCENSSCNKSEEVDIMPFFESYPIEKFVKNFNNGGLNAFVTDYGFHLFSFNHMTEKMFCQDCMDTINAIKEKNHVVLSKNINKFFK